MKKLVYSMLILLTTLAAFSCSNPLDKDLITVVSREASSGTRGAFDEIVGVSVPVGDNLQNNLFKEALIVGSNDAVVLTVAKDPRAIGYASPVGIGNQAKILAINGIRPTLENIASQQYPIYRPFAFIHTPESLKNPNVKDFLLFINSQQGQQIMLDNGYVPSVLEGSNNSTQTPVVQRVLQLPKYNPTPNISGRMVLSGSTSVQKIVQKLQEAYQVLQPTIHMEIQYSGSVAGIKDVMANKVDLGMVSRTLTIEEAQTLGDGAMTIFSYDAVAILVNNENIVNELSMPELQQIFTGTIRHWSDITLEQAEELNP